VSSAAAAWVEVDRLKAVVDRYFAEIAELRDVIDRQRTRIAELEAVVASCTAEAGS